MSSVLKKYLVLFLFGSLSWTLNGQSTFSFDFGILAGNNGNLLGDSLTGFPESIKEFRNGYSAGLKACFGTYGFFLSPGLYYQDYTISNKYVNLDPFIKSPRIRSAKAKVIVGYQADMLKRKLNFRLGGGLNYNYIIIIDKNNLAIDFQTINDKYLAYNFDVGLDIFFLNLGLSYERSIPDVIKSKNKFDFFILTAGINF